MASVTEIDKKIEQLKAQRKALIAKEKARERKERTRRLIQIGAIVEKYAGKMENSADWENYIGKIIDTIKKSQTKSKRSASKDLEIAEEPNPEIQDFVKKLPKK